MVGSDRLEAIWHEVERRVDAPRRSRPERMLRRLGVRRGDGAPGGRDADAAGAVVAGGGRRARVRGLAAAQVDERYLRMFLVVAPLGPLAGVAVAFAGGLDPTQEIGLAAPYSGLRLLLIRTAAVLAVTCRSGRGRLLPGLGLGRRLAPAGTGSDLRRARAGSTAPMRPSSRSASWPRLGAGDRARSRRSASTSPSASAPRSSGSPWPSAALIVAVATATPYTIRLGEKRMTTVACRA